MSHRGRNVVPGSVQIWDGAKWVEGPTLNAKGIQDFPIAVANGDDVLWVGAGGGFGNLFCIGTIPVEDTEVAEMACWLSQVPGGGGGIALGAYSAAGNRIANTAIVAPALGPNVVPLGSPIILTGGTLYYLAVFCNQNGARLLRFSPGAAPPGPAVAFSVPNSRSIDPSGFPANVAGFFGNLTTQRWWIGGGV